VDDVKSRKSRNAGGPAASIGTVGHNGPRTNFSIGFSGFNQAGVGREGGIEGLTAFMESKTIVMA